MIPSSTSGPSPTPGASRRWRRCLTASPMHSATSRPGCVGGRAPRHLRPAPRGHRRRARHLRVSGEGPPAPSPQEAPGAAVFPVLEPRRDALQCEGSPNTWRASPMATGRSAGAGRPTSSGACAARPSWCSTARSCGPSGRCAQRCSSPRPGCWLTSWPGWRRQASVTPSGRCSTGRRAAYLGGLAAATAAGQRRGVVFATRARRRARS